MFSLIRMPYTEAVICEVLRKSYLVPLGVMHRALCGKKFHGFLIKKETFLLGNLYSYHFNQKYWDSPDEFIPERFLFKNGTTVLKKSEAFVPFQVGRRQCIGEQFAKDTWFLFLTSIYQKFQTILYEDDKH